MTEREKLIASLRDKPLRVCQTMHECCLCRKTIQYGDQYRDGGYGRRAHVECLDDPTANVPVPIP